MTMDVKTHGELNRWLSPQEMLENACSKLAIVWPLVDILVCSMDNLNYLAGQSSAKKVDVNIIFDYPGFDRDQLSNYEDIFIICMKEGKPYFQSASLKAPTNLLAVMPLFNYSIPGDDIILQSAPEVKDGAKFGKNGMLCLWRRDNTTPVLSRTDRELLDTIVDQLSTYGKLYGAMLHFKQLVHKLRHDLRTPLTSMTMISGLLDQQEGNTEIQEFGQMLQIAAEKMDRLLRMFKIEFGH